MKEKKIDWPYLGQLALVTCAQLVLLWVLLGYFVRWGFLFGQALSRTQMQLWTFGWGAGFTLLSLPFKTRDSLAFLAVLTDSIITALLAYWVYFLTSRPWYFLLFSLAAVAAAAAIYIASLRQMRRISRQAAAETSDPLLFLRTSRRFDRAHAFGRAQMFLFYAAAAGLVCSSFFTNLSISSAASASQVMAEDTPALQARLDQLQSETWDALSLEQRTETLQAVASLEADACGLPRIQLELVSLQDNIYGQYNNKTGQLQLNRDYITYCDAETALTTLLHEMRHYYQHYTVVQLEAEGLFEQGSFVYDSPYMSQAVKWYRAFLQYGGIEDIQDYHQNVLESDAFSYSHARAPVYLEP